jgi:hypothetical protein
MLAFGDVPWSVAIARCTFRSDPASRLNGSRQPIFIGG